MVKRQNESGDEQRACAMYRAMENVTDWFSLGFAEYVAKWGEEPPSQKRMADRMNSISVSAAGFVSKAIRRKDDQ